MLPYIPAIAVAMLLALAIPVYLPRTGLVLSLGIIALAVFLFVKPVVPPEVKFNWGLDVPLGIAILLYAVLWIGTAGVSLSRERAAVIDQRGLHQVRRAPAV
jgi:hypothetical protein